MTESALSVFGATPGMGALAGFHEAGDAAPMPFPLVSVSKGTFKANKSQSDSVKDLLPDGSRPVTAIFLTYRMGGIAWQVGYDDRTDENKDPAYSFMAPSSDEALGNLIGEATKAYHYTPKDSKGAYDFATSNVGHVQPLIEILCYVPSINGPVAFSTPSNYNSVEETVAVLRSLTDKTTGVIAQAPILLTPMQVHKKTPKWEWDVDYLGIAGTNDAKASAVWDQFKAWLTTAGEDLTMKANLDAWLQCTDRPVSDDIKAALNKAIGLVPRRQR